MAPTAPRKTAAKKATTAARSATARKTAAPKDRRPAATAKTDDLVRVQLHGVDWKIDPATMDDFELLDDLNALDQKEDATRMPSVLRRFLTIPDKDGDPDDSQFRLAMDTLRDKKTGRVTVEAGSRFVWDLLAELNPNS